MKKLAGHRIFLVKNRGSQKESSDDREDYKLLNILVIAVAVFQNFPRYARKSNNFIQHSHIFKQKK